MAINKKLIHFRSKQNFEDEVANNNILDNSIVFIQDSKEISTHGTLYKTVNWSVLDEANGYDYVDLGLPSGTLWATTNIFSGDPEEGLERLAWGELLPKWTYTEDNYQWQNYTSEELKTLGVIGKDGNLTPAYDVASQTLGGNWRLPTKEDIYELKEYCTVTDTIVNGLDVHKITGPNDNYIYIPRGGFKEGDEVVNIGTYYGTASICTEENMPDGQYAYCFIISDGYIIVGGWNQSHGRYIRPVINLNN